MTLAKDLFQHASLLHRLVGAAEEVPQILTVPDDLTCVVTALDYDDGVSNVSFSLVSNVYEKNEPACFHMTYDHKTEGVLWKKEVGEKIKYANVKTQPVMMAKGAPEIVAAIQAAVDYVNLLPEDDVRLLQRFSLTPKDESQLHKNQQAYMRQHNGPQ